MRRRECAMRAIVAGVLCVGPVGIASADHGRYARADADIEKLSAEIREAGRDWRVDVRYDVELEGRGAFTDALSLRLFVTDDEGVVVDPEGRPIEIDIPLDRPTDVDDDELKFESGAVFTLPDGAFAYPDRLRIEAVVLDVRDDTVLDRSSSRMRFDPPVIYEPVIVERPVIAPVYVERPVVVAPVYRPPVVVGHRSVHVSAHFGSGHGSFTRVVRAAPRPVYHRRVVSHRSYHRVTRVYRP